MGVDAPAVNSEEAFILKLKVELEGIDDAIKLLKAQMAEVSTFFGEDIAKQVKENVDTDSGKTTREQDTQKKEKDERTTKLLTNMSTGLDKLSGAGLSVLKGVFGFIQDIFQQIKKSSPLLQAIEQLFNLAWSLFFMPIGNKLGEMLIPAVIQMVDDVMAIWDAFEGQSLGEMFKTAIREGVRLISTFMISIGEDLKEEGGLIGAIGSVLVTMGEFIRDNGESLLTFLAWLAEEIIAHFKEIIAGIVAFKIMSTGLQITQILTTAAAAAPLFGWMGASAVAAVGLTTSAAAGYVGGVSIYDRMADGGYVPATPGGKPVIIGEGGEGEYVVPESKMGKMGSQYTINVYSYSTEETKSLIREVISDEVSMSRLRSGF